MIRSWSGGGSGIRSRSVAATASSVDHNRSRPAGGDPQPDHPPVDRIPGADDRVLGDQRVDHRGEGGRRDPEPPGQVAVRGRGGPSASTPSTPSAVALNPCADTVRR